MRRIILVAVFLLISFGGQINAAQDDVKQADGISLERLTLREAQTLFLTNSRELQAARRRIESAQAATLSAGQKPNPNLSVNTSSISRDPGTGPGNIWEKRADTVFRLDQLLERGNKRNLRIAAAGQTVDATRADFTGTLLQQRLGLFSAYYDLLSAQEKQRTNTEIKQLFARALEAAELRLKAGDVSPVDVARIRIDALRAENDARQAQADHDKAQFTLAHFIGQENAAAKINAMDVWPILEKQMEAADLNEVLTQRADVKAALTRVQVAQSNLSLARALRKRDVTIGAQYEHFPPDNSNSVGVGISVPLFVRYYYEGEIRSAEIDLQAAQDNLERVKAEALSEISKAGIERQASAERLQRFNEDLLVQVRKAAESAEFAYRHGGISVMDLLDTWRTLRATEIEAITAHADYAKAQAAWQTAISTAIKDE